jgi:TrmH family RNA methyltransferase
MRNIVNLHPPNAKKMISQNKIKLINSLSKKKSRDIHQLFIAEGEKLVLDLISSMVKVKWIYSTQDWIKEHPELDSFDITITTTAYLKKISQLKTPPPVIAVYEIPNQSINDNINIEELVLALDEIQDPGNLGTIIRLADWFGIKHIICSKNTVDTYNPKVVQATMGAIGRVHIHYTNLYNFIAKKKEEGISIYGTFLDGQNIYHQQLSNNGIIVMGNEGKGISSEIESLVSKKLLIPTFSTSTDTSESLNVSTATAITLSEFRRKI